jgi:D,D-heptose 1,7-bisphosphate phosphatase
MKNKAVFLDRDGTINIDVHYLADPDKFEMYPGVGEGVRELKNHGFKVIVVTNQSGIGRGYYSLDQLSAIHKKMNNIFLRYDITLDGIYYCPHHPDDHCNCRKPNTGLFEKAISQHNINISKSFMVGDKLLDIEAGKKIGARTILIPELHVREEFLQTHDIWNYRPDYIAENFLEGVRWILKNG